MILNIRNKWVSFRGSSHVRDEHEKDVMIVEGRFFSMRHRKYVKDLEGNVRYQVRNRFWNFFQYCAYVFDDKENKIATVDRRFFSLHDHYDIECSLGALQIRGNILGYNYHISLNGKEIGHVARRISLRDSFTLTIDDDADIYFFVALVIAIDNIVDNMRNDSNAASSAFNS